MLSFSREFALRSGLVLLSQVWIRSPYLALILLAVAMKNDVFSTQESLEKIFQENPDKMAQIAGKFPVSSVASRFFLSLDALSINL